LWTTAGTPKGVVDRIVDAVQTALADPNVRQRLDGLGMVIFPRGQQYPKALVTYHEAEAAKWWPVINAAGIKASN
jgi:tripartite-type tricarboxylate transporter receptor subunit TctC